MKKKLFSIMISFAMVFAMVTAMSAVSFAAAADPAEAVELVSATASGTRAVDLSWTEVRGATKYVVYGARCGKKIKKIASVTDTSYTVKKIKCKKLKAHRPYKFYVIAYNGSGRIVRSKTIHFFTGNTRGKYANVESLSVDPAELELLPGDTSGLSVSKTIFNNKKHIKKSHGVATRYISDAPEIASVSSKGVVTAKSAGTATIYVQDIGGLWQAVPVKVVAPELAVISFEMNGHGTQIDPVTVTKGGKVTEPPAPTERGYRFDGWYKEEACENAWDFLTDNVTADKTLYAKWTDVTVVSEILPEDFPMGSSQHASEINGAWNIFNTNAYCAVSTAYNKLLFENDVNALLLSLDQELTANGNNWEVNNGQIKVVFEMSEDTLTGITVSGVAVVDGFSINGTYQNTACVAAGTMITMANGGQKAVEDIEMGDMIRTFDHETGEVTSSPVCFLWKSENAADAFTLTFEDGVEVTVIEEHGFYDQEEEEYAFINALNAKNYIGHHFYDADNDRWLELEGFEMLSGRVDAYSLATSRQMNHLSNGLLSMSDGSFKMLANMFDYDDQMKFDAEKKNADIDKYGLTPKEKVLELEGFYEEDYDDYNLQYLNVAIGKGLITWEWMEALSDYCVVNGL